MDNLGRRATRVCVALATILFLAIPLNASVIISVTAPPALSTGIENSVVVSTSWSESNAYTDVTITALVDSFLVGQLPNSATAYLTTQIGPGTTVMDEVAHAAFTVPLQLPVCSPAGSCGANVTLFSALRLGPGDYFLTMGPPIAGDSVAAWFPAINPTVIEDTGVTLGPCVVAFNVAIAPYPPASAFGPVGSCGATDNTPLVMNFTVTGTAENAVPEPAPVALIGCGALFLLIRQANRKSEHQRKAARPLHRRSRHFISGKHLPPARHPSRAYRSANAGTRGDKRGSLARAYCAANRAIYASDSFG
jgi:hypothetical protein